MPASLLIQDVNLLSTGCDGWYRNTSVLIRNGLIEEINPDETGLEVEVTRVAGQGGYLLPGMIEMHGHFYGRANIDMRSQHAGYCPLFLAGGVTTVRTPGEFEPDLTYAWKHTNESGQTIGPRIMTGGWYFDRSPSIIKWFQPSASLDEVRACFDERDRVSDFFKVYSSMPTEWIGEVCRLGHARGKKVYGHLGMSTTVGAIEAGLDGIEHGFFTIQEFHSKPSPMIDMDGLDDLDMGADIVRRVQDVIVGHGTAVTPTLLTFMLNGPDYTRWLGEMDAWRYLDPGALQKQRELRQTWDSDQKAIDQQERLIEKQRRFVGDLYRQGARIFCGTDPSYPMILPGKGLVREAANLVDCGLPEPAVLRALTIEAARELGIDSITGSVEKGKQADLVLLDLGLPDMDGL
ncbi:MAG: amidohydrolase family protein, partial [Anaerolineaceae bacterium]